MKKFLFLFLCFSLSAMAQTINNYKYVIVPLKYTFLKTENQYRLNTITKMELNNLGFVAFYENEFIPDGIDKDRCGFLYVNVESTGGMLSTKLFLTFKDCQNNLVYQSEVGTSRKKDFAEGYQQALKNATATIKYSFEGSLPISKTIATTTTKPAAVQAPVAVQTPVAAKSTGTLKAEAISSGYLLIDETSSMIVLRLTKTSDAKTFIAQRQNTQGVLIQKDGEWFFEYFKDDKMVSEKINVTF